MLRRRRYYIAYPERVRIAGALNVTVMTLLKDVPGGAEPGKADASVTELLAHSQPLRLVQAFAPINDKAVRQSLMLLTEAVPQLAQRRRPSPARR